MVPPVCGDRFGMYATKISDVPPSVARRIAVQKFAIVSFERNADPVPFARDRSEILDSNDAVILIDSPPLEGYHTACGVMKINPVKSGIIKIDLI